jgi:ABC-type sugar transport system ATPase subunit
MNATIEIDGLRKRFGSVQALDGMTLTVGPGQVTGFVGPNGPGKSTTMRVVVGRGKVIADTSVADLIAASRNQITLRTTAPADAMTVLAGAGACLTCGNPRFRGPRAR